MLEYHSRLERHTSMQRIPLTSCQRRSNICSAVRKNFIFFQKPAWQIAKWVYIKTVITDKVMIPKWRGSSVGRAEDWKSSCHQFDPGPCHHFLYLRQSNRLAFLLSPPRLTLKNSSAKCPESYRPHQNRAQLLSCSDFFENTCVTLDFWRSA